MTPDEKHALIAEKLEGYKWVSRVNHCFLVDADEAGYLVSSDWMTEYGQSKPLAPRSYDKVPDYSTDLNLCARVQGKIEALGWKVIALYEEKLKAIWRDDPTIEMSLPFWYINAPATARVDAMVALIQSLTE